MFYSHTFLAKKSPLGTVWIAAHLERRIKKPQIEVIDIPSYADCIMFPEVPIALRLSGHLLLGLVRIYSWKVKYLYDYCTRVLTDVRTTIASVQVNLPEEADRAAFESVTLPNTFELDALELDDAIYQPDRPDNHTTTYDQIASNDNIPFGGDQYVTFVIDEDVPVDPSPQPRVTNLDAVPMEEDVLPSSDVGPDAIATPVEHVMGTTGHGPSNQELGSMHIFNEERFSQEFPEIEVMRSAVNNFESLNFPVLSDVANLDIGGLGDISTHPMNRKESLTPIMESVSVSDVGLAPSTVHDKLPTSASIDDQQFGGGTSLGQPLLDLELQPSPLPAQEPRVNRRRRRNLVLEEYIVLPNEEMRSQIFDPSKLTKKRRKLPCSTLDIWRFRRASQKEQIFNEPLLSGMSNTLQETSKKIFPRRSVDAAPAEASARPTNAGKHISVTGTNMEPEHPQSDARADREFPGFRTPDVDMAPEQPRFDDRVHKKLHDSVPSVVRREDFTPLETTNLGSASDIEKTFGTAGLPTFEIPASAKPPIVETETPFARSAEEWPFNDKVPEIPSLRKSVDVEELSFLDASTGSSDHEQANVDNMSARTRAVARYLKDHSPSTQNFEDQTGNLSLDRILEGKTRKQCARMFFETLVLKSYDLIDVQQEEAYRDILISLKPSLSTAKLLWQQTCWQC